MANFKLAGLVLPLTITAIAWWAAPANLVFVPGDYNGDQVVDAQDFTVWRSNFGGTVAPGTGADGNGNGVVDSADYVIWRKAVNAESGSSLASVPEPSAIGIGLVAVFICGAYMRKSRTALPRARNISSRGAKSRFGPGQLCNPFRVAVWKSV